MEGGDREVVREGCLLRAAVAVLGVGLGSTLGDFLFRLLETGCAHLLFSTFQDSLALFAIIHFEDGVLFQLILDLFHIGLSLNQEGYLSKLTWKLQVVSLLVMLLKDSVGKWIA